jgi:hypothetical protein
LPSTGRSSVATLSLAGALNARFATVAEAKKVTVYSFQIRDDISGEDKVWPRKATAVAIARIKGAHKLDETAEEVDRPRLDSAGIVKA